MVFKYGPGGAFLCDEEIPDITQPLNREEQAFYGGKFFIGETIRKEAAKKLATLLGGTFEDEEA